MEKSDDTGKLIAAVLLGAAIGLALGVLFAPNKGSVTRAKLVNGFNDLSEEMGEASQDEEMEKQADASGIDPIV